MHLHSLHSDGTEPPAQVIVSAYQHGLRTVALTDHDTTSGWAEAADAAANLAMTFLPGMELSARHQFRSVHVLAYLVDPDHSGLRDLIERIRSSRRDRIHAMAEKIGRDFDLNWEQFVAQTTVGATLGRPHLADALVLQGHVQDRTQAFADILHPRSPYYVALYAPDPATAVQQVVAAGGVAILAHPAGRGGTLPRPVLERMLAAGLSGFELGHRENLEPGVSQLERLCRERDLIVTGSSDYHGTGKPNAPGENTTSDEMVARIIETARGSSPVFASS